MEYTSLSLFMEREGCVGRKAGRKKGTHLAQDAQDLGASDRGDLGDTVRVTKHNADLRGGHALSGVFDNFLLDLKKKTSNQNKK